MDEFRSKIHEGYPKCENGFPELLRSPDAQPKLMFLVWFDVSRIRLYAGENWLSIAFRLVEIFANIFVALYFEINISNDNTQQVLMTGNSSVQCKGEKAGFLA